MTRTFAAVIALLLMAGCAYQTVEPEPVVTVLPVAVAPAEPALPLGGPSGPLGASVRQMAEQLDASLSQRGIRSMTIAISPFVELDQPLLHRDFGDQLAERFYHELQSRGYNLIDHRALPFADATAAVDTPKLAEFYRQHRISYVLSGTFAAHPDGVSVHARMLDTITKQVVATGQSEVGLRAMEGGFPGYDPFSSRDGLIIENGGVPVQ